MGCNGSSAHWTFEAAKGSLAGIRPESRPLLASPCSPGLSLLAAKKQCNGKRMRHFLGASGKLIHRARGQKTYGLDRHALGVF